MSQTLSQRSGAFKFSLQEEKFNQLKKLSEVEPLTQSNEFKLDLNNEYLKQLTEKYKTEISNLKNYINRLNKEIRKNFSMEIPLLDFTENVLSSESEGESSENSQNFEKHFENILNYFKDSVNRLINPDYLNPIFSIYDNHLINIENELKFFKSLCTKYESRINELVKENSELREATQIQSNELKNLLKTRIESDSSLIILDEDYFKQLSERNDLLSKENEILAINYQRVSKELFDFSMSYNEKHKESLNKIEIYDKLDNEFNKLSYVLDELSMKNKVLEYKIFEMTGSLSKSEIEKDKMRNLLDQYKSELFTMKEANNFYKSYINKN